MKKVLIIFGIIFIVSAGFLANIGYKYNKYKNEGLLFKGRSHSSESQFYYYRNPQPDMIVFIIKKWVDSLWWFQETEDYEMSIHFFATILSSANEKIDQLQSMEKNYSGRKLSTIRRIIMEAKEFKPAKPDSVDHLNLMWVEFYATGNEEIIQEFLKVLELPTSSMNLILIKAQERSFRERAPQHFKIYTMLDRISNSTQKQVSERIVQLIDIIKERSVDSAHNCLVKGYNYYTQKDYVHALDEYQKALNYFPDYPNVYINMANAYEALGKREEAFSCMLKAVQIDPSSASACYGLGRYYFMRGKFDDAIIQYQQALKYYPKKPTYFHALARSYQNKGDVNNAVKYFLGYLKYAPHGENVELVKGYLRSVNVPLPEKKPDVLDLLLKKDYPSLDQCLSTILHEKKKDKFGSSCLSSAYRLLHENPNAPYQYEQWVKVLEGWLQANPDSHFANACMGIFHIDYAWQARGSGWANTITDEGSQLFKKRIQQALDYLRKAYKLDASDPIVAAKLVVVAMALGLERNEMEDYFQKALRADNSEYTAYQAKLTYLMPKWHGSEKEMFAFARETVKSAPDNSLAPVVLANAHWEMYARLNNDRTYFKQPEIWKELKDTYRMLCRRFPESENLHNWFCRTAYLSGDYNTAREEMKVIKDQWLEETWGNYIYFSKIKNELLLSDN